MGKAVPVNESVPLGTTAGCSPISVSDGASHVPDVVTSDVAACSGGRDVYPAAFDVNKSARVEATHSIPHSTERRLMP